MKYRPEIDGLRALAVLPVILFHAGFEAFGGGFVGVDIFFVISGYLITKMIFSELDQGKFNILSFYERRIRRIVPALFFMMAICIPISWMLLLPDDMKNFSQSVSSVPIFSSNILFWLESGYFDTAAEYKPLLHTWSLAVEEQYYVLFPIFAVIFWRRGVRFVVVAISLLASLSLLYANWASVNQPEAAFFLLPSRAWEILLGACVSFYPADRHLLPGSKTAEKMLGSLGVLLILGAIFLYDKNTPFPGLYAVVPTIGACLLIIFAGEVAPIYKVLTSKILVQIGLLSYSAYLWHQPIFAFVRCQSVFEVSNGLMLLLCLLTLIVSYFSWKYVEGPARKLKISQSLVFKATLVATILFVALGLVGHLTNGYEKQWLARQSDNTRKAFYLLKTEKKIHSRQSNNSAIYDNGDCVFDSRQIDSKEESRLIACSEKYGPGVVILGDSHASDLYGAVTSTNKDARFLFGLTKGRCRPHSPSPDCQYDAFLAFLQEHQGVFSQVIYEQAGFYLLRTDKIIGDRSLFEGNEVGRPGYRVYPNSEYIKKVHDYLRAVNGFVPVLWFGSRLEPHISERDIIRHGCDYAYNLKDYQYSSFESLDEAIEEISSAGGIEFISQNKTFRYKFPEDFMNCDSIYWSDGDHLSSAGERRFGARYDLLRRKKE